MPRYRSSTRSASSLPTSRSSATTGVSPFPVSELDSLLRNEGVSTIVPAGVAVNWAITGLTFDAINRGYDVVIPRDAVTGIPTDYAAMAIDHSLAFVATISSTDDVVAAWAGG